MNQQKSFKAGSRLEKVLLSGHFAVTAELGPPKSADLELVRRKIGYLKSYVDAANITDNQTAIVRLSSIATATVLCQNGLEPVIQMTCRDRNRIAIQSDILGAYALGIKNILCLTGDHQSLGNHPGARGVFDLDSIQFVQAVKTMRDEGIILGGESLASSPDIFIGAAANPFADPLEFRVIRLAKKIEAGAGFIQTQCIYNIERFETWLNMAADRGLTEKAYILGGVTPLKSPGMAKYMKNKVSGMDVPDDIIKRMEGVPKDKQREEGIRICVETILRLREMPGVKGVHVMAIEWEDAVGEIVEKAGLLPRPIS